MRISSGAERVVHLGLFGLIIPMALGGSSLSHGALPGFERAVAEVPSSQAAYAATDPVVRLFAQPAALVEPAPAAVEPAAPASPGPPASSPIPASRPSPNPTPNPAPTPGRGPDPAAPATIPSYTPGSIQDIIVKAFAPLGAPAVQWALRVAYCESRYNPTAVEPHGHYGLFQFAPATWRSTPYGAQSWFDPVANANAAAWLYVHSGPGQWECR